MIAPELTVRYTDSDREAQLRADVRTGLAATPKWLPPKWFYDATGSALFERITRLPEYYPTRAEHEILRQRSAEIAEVTEVDTLVELGSGSSEKTRLLLEALHRHGTLKRFVPLDVSEPALAAAVRAITEDYPSLAVHGVVDDFTTGLAVPEDGRRMVAFLGGTVGNLLPNERRGFLRSVRSALRPGEWLLLGTDLVKDPHRLVSAYDDASGVTAEFNRNVLRVINHQLGADFIPEQFQHRARWEPSREWIEMWLLATTTMRVTISALPMTVSLAQGEGIRTEISAKFRRGGVLSEVTWAGFEPCQWWTDTADDFAVSLFRAAR